MSEELEVPKEGKSHKAQAIIKGGLGAIPFVGGAVGETFDLIYKSGYEKRLEKWRIDVSARLNKLSDTVSISDLLKNDEFQSLLSEATVIALKNHQEIKLDAILNMVENSPGSPVDYDFKKLFLNYVDNFTGYHLRTLGLIAERHQQINEQNLDLEINFPQKILEEVFQGDEELRNLIMEELKVGKGLIAFAFLEYVPSRPESYVLSQLGIKFMKLITGIDYTQQFV